MPLPAVPSEAPAAPFDAASLRGASRLRLLVAYGLGDAGTGMAASLIGFYLFIFYTAAAGLPAWMAGLVLMLARLWDAVNDPIVGWLSDKTRSRWGPRLPWLVGSALPLGIAMALMWWLPPGSDWVRFWVFVAVSVLANSLYTCVNLPYAALAAELTTEVSLRTRLNMARFTGSITAGLVGIVLGGRAAARPPEPRELLAGGRALRLDHHGVHVALCLGHRARRPPLPATGGPERHHPAPAEAGHAATAASCGCLGLYLLLWCALQIMQTAALIFLPVVMRVPEGWSNWILLPFQISTLVGLQVWTAVSHRQGRIRALLLGSGLWVAGCLGAMVLAPLDSRHYTAGLPRQWAAALAAAAHDHGGRPGRLHGLFDPLGAVARRDRRRPRETSRPIQRLDGVHPEDLHQLRPLLLRQPDEPQRLCGFARHAATR